MIEILQIAPGSDGVQVRLGCACGASELASYECDDDQIIFCPRCGAITSRARLRNASTLGFQELTWHWVNVSSRAECPLINVSLQATIDFDPDGDGLPNGLPALVTKLSTERCLLRLERQWQLPATVATLDPLPRRVRLRASEPPLEGEMLGALEEIVRLQGDTGVTYYKIRFIDLSPEMKANLEMFFEDACGLKFDWRVLLLADLPHARHLRSLLLQCLPMARIEVAGDAERFRGLLGQEAPDLVLLPPEPSLIAAVRSAAAADGRASCAVIVLLKEQTASAVREALRLGPHEILSYHCDLNDMRRALQRVRQPDAAPSGRLHPAARANRTLDPSIPALQPMVEEDLVRLLCVASETHDANSSAHLKRMSAYTAAISRKLGWSEDRVARLALASKLHDIGKIGVPDSILHNTGALTEDERRIMQQHTRFGYHILHESASEVLRLGAIIALRHHERYDGSGYPDGVAGEAIPIECQIVSVADVFDALTTQRAYKPAWSNAKAVDYIRQMSGKMFNPAAVEAFLQALPEIENSQLRFMDDFRNVWTERRRSPRVATDPVPLELTIAMPEQTFRPIALRARLCNLSEGGFKCLVDGVSSDLYGILCNTRRYAKLQCTDPAWMPLNQVFCNVVWLDYYSVPDPMQCVMGMSFQKAPPAFFEWVRKIVNESAGVAVPSA